MMVGKPSKLPLYDPCSSYSVKGGNWLGGYLTPSQNAGMRFSNVISRQMRLLRKRSTGPLYHYTSYNSLISIIETGIFRAGSIKFLNDASEIRYAVSIFRACLDRKRARSTGKRLELLSAMQARMQVPLEIANVYSASFCDSPNQDDMWGLYGERGHGFAFSVSELHSRGWFEHPFNAELYKCQYSEDLLTKLCFKALNEAETMFEGTPLAPNDDTIEADLNPFGIGYDAASFANEYLDQLAHAAAAFKPRAWQSEREWRYVFVKYADESPPRFVELDISARDNTYGISAIYAGPECNLQKINEIRRLLEKMNVSTSVTAQPSPQPQRDGTT